MELMYARAALARGSDATQLWKISAVLYWLEHRKRPLAVRLNL